MLLRAQTLFVEVPIILIVNNIDMVTWIRSVWPIVLVFLHLLNRLVNLILVHLGLQKLLVAGVGVQVGGRDVRLVLKHAP